MYRRKGVLNKKNKEKIKKCVVSTLDFEHLKVLLYSSKQAESLKQGNKLFLL